MCGRQAITCPCVYTFAGLDYDRLCEDHPEIYNGGPTEEMDAAFEAEIAKLGGRLPWTGEWPHVEQCRRLGWFAYFSEGRWKPCDEGHPEAIPDMNRLLHEGRWDVKLSQWVVREA